MTTTPSPITSGEALKNEVTITASGPVGSGKSALLGEIEIMCKALGLRVRYADEAAAQAEKNATHAEWTAELEMYQPSVVLVEDMPWLAQRRSSITSGQPAPADKAFYDFWYSHMHGDEMTGTLADVAHSTARYIWDGALATASTAPAPVAQSERDAWISVDERLPEQRDNTYMVLAYSGHHVDATPDWAIREWPASVTHWMPLPSPPAIAAQQPAEGGEQSHG